MSFLSLESFIFSILLVISLIGCFNSVYAYEITTLEITQDDIERIEIKQVNGIGLGLSIAGLCFSVGVFIYDKLTDSKVVCEVSNFEDGYNYGYGQGFDDGFGLNLDDFFGSGGGGFGGGSCDEDFLGRDEDFSGREEISSLGTCSFNRM